MLVTASPLEQASCVSSGSLGTSSEQAGSSLLAERRAPQRSGLVGRVGTNLSTAPRLGAEWGLPMPAAGSGCGRE